MSTYNWSLGVFVSGTLVSFQKEGRRQKERKQLALELSSRDEIACNSGTALFVASLQYWCLKYSDSWVMFRHSMFGFPNCWWRTESFPIICEQGKEPVELWQSQTLSSLSASRRTTRECHG